MASGEEWLFRPMTEGWVSFREYHDGSIDLNDVADMNELIDVRDANAALLRRAMARG